MGEVVGDHLGAHLRVLRVRASELARGHPYEEGVEGPADVRVLRADCLRQARLDLAHVRKDLVHAKEGQHRLKKCFDISFATVINSMKIAATSKIKVTGAACSNNDNSSSSNDNNDSNSNNDSNNNNSSSSSKHGNNLSSCSRYSENKSTYFNSKNTFSASSKDRRKFRLI